MTLHDVVRFLVRGSYFPDEEQQRRALLAVDAHEKGYPDAETYEAELAKQAAANRQATGEETAEEKSTRLEAENVRLQALVAAQTRQTPVAPTP